MLRLKRLELQGFKSFCDRTELRFSGTGIVAIVGPNGCGKSNLGDAISWVLGEQSAKSLRGTRMEDVIFAGTRDRKPVSMAMVSMTLVDPDAETLVAEVPREASKEATGPNGSNGSGALSVEEDGLGHKRPGEIVITRRLFRSGESEYLIDGRPARLRDIQDIFMGTGLGPESYAIIEQGRIGQILSSRPMDRRALIEEAAGVSKFKVRRKLAEAKLESAKQNLSRVFDILEEVGRQVNSLKRQAAKAKRYEEIRAELRSHLRALLSGRYCLLERDTARVALELNAAGARLRELAAQVEAEEQQYVQTREESYSAEKELAEARRVLADLKVESERVRGRLQSQVQQIESIDKRLTLDEKELEQVRAQAEIASRELENQLDRLAKLEQEVLARRGELATKASRRDQFQRELGDTERQIEQGRQAAVRLLGEASTLKNRLVQIREYLASLDRELARAQKEEATALADLEWVTAGIRETEARFSAKQQELEATRVQREAVESELTEKRRLGGQVRKNLEVLRAEYSRVKARRDSLQEILSHRAYTTESVKKLFAAAAEGRTGGLRPLGVLADFIEVDPQFERVVEEFLAEELEYVVVETWEQAENGIALFKAELEGHGTFLVHPQRSPGLPESAAPLGPETGIIARLDDVVRLTNGLGQAGAKVIPKLARAYIGEDAETARRLALQYPCCYFITPDGRSYSGLTVSGGKGRGHGPLALKRELRELAAAVALREKEMADLSAQLEELERSIENLEKEVERLRGAEQACEREKLGLEHELKKLREEQARVSNRASAARAELERLGRDKDLAARQSAEIEAAIRDKEEARRQAESEIEQFRRRAQALQSQLSTASEEHSALRAELAGLEERLRAEVASRRRLEQQLEELRRRQEGLTREIQQLNFEKTRLVEDNAGLEKRSLELTEQIATAEEKVQQLSAREEALRAELVAREEKLRELRTAQQEAQQVRSEKEVELVQRQAELKYLDETSRKELGEPLAAAAGQDQPVQSEEELTELEQRCEELRSRLEALGPVNPQALEEYQEAQQRYDFLNAQRQDLVDSIRDTEKAIQEIDQESKRRFQQAFEAINANFREIFRTLFGGGSAEMRLTDEANTAESGIEIVASPPGKRLQNVLLLSGGEKALVAIALVLAIFKYQPSPFCVMDEVDAPLDEANIERFTRLLKEMSTQTQFILITHAKRTMEAADALYGVTMQEPGVSKIVSVRLHRSGIVPAVSQDAAGASMRV